MKLLVRGSQSSERVDLLLRFTRIDNEYTIAAIKAHLVQGQRVTRAAYIHGMPASNLFRALNVLEQVAIDIERIKAHDFKNISDK